MHKDKTSSTLNDFTVPYAEAVKMLGRTKRWIQEKVSSGELRKEKGDNGRVLLSLSQLQKLNSTLGEKKDEAGEAKQELAKYQGGMGALVPQFEQMKEQIAAKDERIIELAKETGILKGHLESARKEVSDLKPFQEKLKSLKNSIQLEKEERLKSKINELKKKNTRVILIYSIWGLIALGGIVLAIIVIWPSAS